MVGFVQNFVNDGHSNLVAQIVIKGTASWNSNYTQVRGGHAMQVFSEHAEPNQQHQKSN